MDQVNTAPTISPSTPPKPTPLLPVLLTITSIIFFISTLLFAIQTASLQNQLNEIERSIRPKPTPTVSPAALPTTQTATDAASWIRFTEKNNMYTFQYPSDFKYYPDLSQTANLTMFPICDPGSSSCFFVDPNNYYPGTNFKGAGFSISFLPKANTKSACDSETVPDSRSRGTKTLGVTTYRFLTLGGAAAGNQSNDLIYIGWQEDSCFRVTVRIITDSSDVNTPPGQVKTFTADQSDELTGIFEKIITTVKITMK